MNKRVYMIILGVFLLVISIPSQAKKKPLEKPILKFGVGLNDIKFIECKDELIDEENKIKITKNKNKEVYIIEYYNDYNVKKKTMFEPTTKIVPIIFSSVRYDTKTNYFIYSYEILNENSARQNIKQFAFYYPYPIDKTEIPDGWEAIQYKYGNTDFLHWYANIPINFDLTRAKKASETKDIKPGERLRGFVLYSKKIPGIIDCFLRGFPDIVPYFEETEPPNDLLPSPNKQKIFGKIVGPVEPPKVSTVAEFIDYIIPIVEETYSLEWLEDKKLKEEFISDLKKIKTIKNKNTVKNNLESFLTKIKKYENKKGIEQEVIDLLYFNVKYMIENLDSLNKKQ